MDIFRHRPICGLFPLKCQSLRQTFQRIIQTIICETPSPLLLLVLFARTKLNSRTSSRKSFIIAGVDFWVLKKKREKKNTAEHVIMNKFFIYARACVNTDQGVKS